jgi:hypothetical protein
MKTTHPLARSFMRRNGNAAQGHEMEPHIDGDRMREYRRFGKPVGANSEPQEIGGHLMPPFDPAPPRPPKGGQ